MRFGTPGWDPKEKTVPSHGSTLVGVSKEGAFKLLETIKKEKKPMHFDIWLRDACVNQTGSLQASYVLPSTGNFDEHISGCDPTDQHRRRRRLVPFKLGRLLVPGRHSH